MTTYSWNITSPKQKIQPIAYFPKVAIAEFNMPMSDGFRSAIADLEMEVDSKRAESVKFLIWDKAEANRLTAILKAHQSELPMEWTSMDFSAELPVELQSLQFYDVDNLEAFHKAGFLAYTVKLDPEQIADLPAEGAVKPKVFFYGGSMNMPHFVNTFFGQDRKKNNSFQTYGYGDKPDMYDNWYSADFISELIVRNRTETEYCFDAVVCTISTEFVGFLDAVMRDQKKDIDWADSKIRPGGLLVLYGKVSNIKYHLGTLVNRFEDFSVTYPAAGYAVVMCTKKPVRFRDDAARDVLEEVITFSGNQWNTPNASFINAEKEKVYTIAGDTKLEPAIFTRWMGTEYVSRFCNEYPFKALSKIFKRAEETETTTLVTTPSVTQLTKLRLRGIIEGKDGEVIVTKQTDETVTSEKVEIDYDEDGEEKATRRIVRTRKRVRQISLVLRDPKTNLHTNPLRKGDAIVVDAA